MSQTMKKTKCFICGKRRKCEQAWVVRSGRRWLCVIRCKPKVFGSQVNDITMGERIV